MEGHVRVRGSGGTCFPPFLDGRLCTVGVGGGAVTEIRTGLGGVRADFLDWSPDGRTIAFTGSEGGDEELWLMEDFLHLVKRAR